MHFSCFDWFTQSRLTLHITLVWPYMVNGCAKRCQAKTFFAGKQNFSLNKAKKKKRKRFCGKFGSSPTFRNTRKGKKCFYDEPLFLSHYKVLHNIASVLIKFFRFLSHLLAFFARISYFLNFWSLRNLIKQSLHSRLLDMRLVIANSALRASLAIYHLISNARSWNNC